MQKPRTFGIIVIIYALAAHLWGTFAAVGFMTMPHKPLEQVTDYLSAAYTVSHPFLLFMYLGGGAGFFMLRRWGALVSLAAAGADILIYIISAVSILLSFGKMTSPGFTQPSFLSMMAPLAGVAIPCIIAFLALQLHRDTDSWNETSGEVSAGDTWRNEQDKCAEGSWTQYFLRAIIITGLLLPWFVGAGVKLYLSSIGKPTVPWAYFLSPGSILILTPFSIWFAISYIMLAYSGRQVLAKPFLGLRSCTGRTIFISGGLAGGIIGTVRTFIDVFWVFDFLYFLTPLWSLNIPYMLAGLLAGYAAGKGYEKFFRS
ncbi:MAG: hypothetical protein HGB36_06600 [Chlorobiaceae bacterium]|jgi:hypothetical protein|nr:hypothetical protein [Chlorobiaceae bacterium]